MLRAAPLPPLKTLTPRAQAFAFPDLTPAALVAFAKAKADAEGSALDFSAAALMAAAQRATGLEDFGAAPLLDPLTVLCRSLNEELEFHALGRSYVRQQLLGLLSTRLRFEALWTKRPEILHR